MSNFDPLSYAPSPGTAMRSLFYPVRLIVKFGIILYNNELPGSHETAKASNEKDAQDVPHSSTQKVAAPAIGTVKEKEHTVLKYVVPATATLPVPEFATCPSGNNHKSVEKPLMVDASTQTDTEAAAPTGHSSDGKLPWTEPAKGTTIETSTQNHEECVVDCSSNRSSSSPATLVNSTTFRPSPMHAIANKPQNATASKESCLQEEREENQAQASCATNPAENPDLQAENARLKSTIINLAQKLSEEMEKRKVAEKRAIAAEKRVVVQAEQAKHLRAHTEGLAQHFDSQVGRARNAEAETTRLHLQMWSMQRESLPAEEEATPVEPQYTSDLEQTQEVANEPQCANNLEQNQEEANVPTATLDTQERAADDEAVGAEFEENAGGFQEVTEEVSAADPAPTVSEAALTAEMTAHAQTRVELERMSEQTNAEIEDLKLSRNAFQNQTYALTAELNRKDAEVSNLTSLKERLQSKIVLLLISKQESEPTIAGLKAAVEQASVNFHAQADLIRTGSQELTFLIELASRLYARVSYADSLLDGRLGDADGLMRLTAQRLGIFVPGESSFVGEDVGAVEAPEVDFSVLHNVQAPSEHQPGMTEAEADQLLSDMYEQDSSDTADVGDERPASNDFDIRNTEEATDPAVATETLENKPKESGFTFSPEFLANDHETPQDTEGKAKTPAFTFGTNPTQQSEQKAKGNATKPIVDFASGASTIGFGFAQQSAGADFASSLDLNFGSTAPSTAASNPFGAGSEDSGVEIEDEEDERPKQGRSKKTRTAPVFKGTSSADAHPPSTDATPSSDTTQDPTKTEKASIWGDAARVNLSFESFGNVKFGASSHTDAKDISETFKLPSTDGFKFSKAVAEPEASNQDAASEATTSPAFGAGTTKDFSFSSSGVAPIFGGSSKTSTAASKAPADTTSKAVDVGEKEEQKEGSMKKEAASAPLFTFDSPASGEKAKCDRFEFGTGTAGPSPLFGNQPKSSGPSSGTKSAKAPLFSKDAFAKFNSPSSGAKADFDFDAGIGSVPSQGASSTTITSDPAPLVEKPTQSNNGSASTTEAPSSPVGTFTGLIVPSTKLTSSLIPTLATFPGLSVPSPDVTPAPTPTTENLARSDIPSTSAPSVSSPNIDGTSKGDDEHCPYSYDDDSLFGSEDGDDSLFGFKDGDDSLFESEDEGKEAATEEQSGLEASSVSATHPNDEHQEQAISAEPAQGSFSTTQAPLPGLVVNSDSSQAVQTASSAASGVQNGAEHQQSESRMGEDNPLNAETSAPTSEAKVERKPVEPFAKPKLDISALNAFLDSIRPAVKETPKVKTLCEELVPPGTILWEGSLDGHCKWPGSTRTAAEIDASWEMEYCEPSGNIIVPTITVTMHNTPDVKNSGEYAFKGKCLPVSTEIAEGVAQTVENAPLTIRNEDGQTNLVDDSAFAIDLAYQYAFGILENLVIGPPQCPEPLAGFDPEVHFYSGDWIGRRFTTFCERTRQVDEIVQQTEVETLDATLTATEETQETRAFISEDRRDAGRVLAARRGAPAARTVGERERGPQREGAREVGPQLTVPPAPAAPQSSNEEASAMRAEVAPEVIADCERERGGEPEPQQMNAAARVEDGIELEMEAVMPPQLQPQPALQTPQQMALELEMDVQLPPQLPPQILNAPSPTSNTQHPEAGTAPEKTKHGNLKDGSGKLRLWSMKRGK